MLGTGDDLRARAQPLDGPAISLGARDRARARHRPRRRLDLRARRRRGQAAQHLACTSAPTARSRRSTASCTCSTSRSTGRATRVRHEEPGDEAVLTRDRRRRRGRDDHLLRRPLPRALPRPRRCAARAILTVPAAFTLATTRDHWEVLLRARAIENQASSSPPTRSASTRRGNRSGGRSHDRRPVGPGPRASPPTRRRT